MQLSAFSPEQMSYLEFRIALRSKGPEEVWFRWAESPVGKDEGLFALPLGPEQVEEALAALPRASRDYAQRKVYKAGLDPMRGIGEQLFAALFAGRREALFRKAQDAAGGTGGGLRLRLELDDPEMVDLPWEFLHCGQDYLALSDSSPVVRCSGPLRLPHPPADGPDLRMLVVDSTPPALASSWGPADQSGAMRRAAEGLQGRARLRLEVLDAPTVQQLAEALRRGFHIVQFVGPGPDPGSAGPALWLRDADGAARAVDTHSLAPMLQDPQPALVFLSAGPSHRSAHELARRCPAVLGLRAAMSEEAARTFVEGTVSGILGGLPLDAAVARGRMHLSYRLPGSREWGLPVLYLGTPDGRLFPTGQPSREPEPASSDAGGEEPRPVSKEHRKSQALLTIRRKNLEALEQQAQAAGEVPAEVRKQIDALREEIARLEQELASMP